MGGGTYIRAGSSKNTCIIFSLTEGVGALAEALKVFKVSYNVVSMAGAVEAGAQGMQLRTHFLGCWQFS